MLLYKFLAGLIIFNIILTHGYKFVGWYYGLWRLLVKPKFKIGERVMVGTSECEVIAITKQNPPYVYFCCPVYLNNGSIAFNPYIKQREMKRKTGIFKELD